MKIIDFCMKFRLLAALSRVFSIQSEGAGQELRPRRRAQRVLEGVSAHRPRCRAGPGSQSFGLGLVARLET